MLMLPPSSFDGVPVTLPPSRLDLLEEGIYLQQCLVANVLQQEAQLTNGFRGAVILIPLIRGSCAFLLVNPGKVPKGL